MLKIKLKKVIQDKKGNGMSRWLIWGVGLLYLAVAIEQIQKGNMGLGISFIGYFIGNIGLGLAAK